MRRQTSSAMCPETNIARVFLDDPSFRSEFGKNITMSAKLTVLSVTNMSTGAMCN